MFTFDGSDFHQKVDHVEVLVHNLPFDRGAMRQVYMMQTLGGAEPFGVCKVSRWTDEPYSKKEASRDIKSLAIASFLASEFCKCCDLQPDKFRFVQSCLYECDSEDLWGCTKSHVFVGEEYLNTRFIKFNGNDGFVNYLDQSLEAQAFIHFTFQACGEGMMVSDIQGVRVDGGLLLTDPQILLFWNGFEPGNLGAKGMRGCMDNHEWNYLCHRFTKKIKANTLLERMPGAPITSINSFNLAQLFDDP